MKPEIAKHELLFQTEQETGFPVRFVWAVLPTVCDREGRFKWRPGALKTDIIPYDKVDFAAVLEALRANGFIRKYEVDGEVYGYLPTFHKHQVINQREAKSAIPPPPDGPVENLETAKVPPSVREEVFARDNYRCVRCQATLDLTIDHIFPLSAGGSHAETNLRTLCRSCNSARPVAGQALIDDLARDGFTLADRERLCTHMQAHAVHGMEGKGTEGNGREGKEGRGPETLTLVATTARLTADDIVAMWNDLVTSPIPRVMKLTGDRRRKVEARIKDYPDVEHWRAVITWLNGQAWCRAPGRGDHPNWTATLDWLCSKQGTLAQYLERSESEAVRRSDQGQRRADRHGHVPPCNTQQECTRRALEEMRGKPA